jgi:hypothetical protein
MTLGGFDVEGFQCVLGPEIALVVDNSVIAIYDRGGSLQHRSSFGLFDREKIESTQVVLHFFLFLLMRGAAGAPGPSSFSLGSSRPLAGACEIMHACHRNQAAITSPSTIGSTLLSFSFDVSTRVCH